MTFRNTSCRRLVVLDPSSGPSGLSRYLEMLWPALDESFELVVVGDSDGPFRNFPAHRFEAIPRELCAPDWRQTSGAIGARAQTRTVTTNRPGILSRGWRTFAPGSLKAAAGAARQAWRLAKIIHKCRPDVVYLPICGDDYLGLAARFAGVRSVGTLHHLPTDKPWQNGRMIASAALSAFTRVIAVSSRVADAWITRHPQLSRRLVTIPNGIAPPETLEKCRQEALLDMGLADATGPLLLAAGRLTEEKGFFHLIDAAALIRQEIESFTIAIAGEGPLESKLRERIAEHGLQRHVRLLGHVNVLGSLYSAADAFILSSMSEAMPYVVLEAMSFGVPVVATDVGGVPELVKDGETGLLVAPGNSDALATAVVRLLRSPQQSREWVLNAGHLIATEFSITEMRSRTVQVFRDAMAFPRATNATTR